MSEAVLNRSQTLQKAAIVIGGGVFVYLAVLQKLTLDWWTDENYSHGLLVPFVIGIVIWREWGSIRQTFTEPSPVLGGILMGIAAIMLVAGTLGAELFTQRVSLVLMAAGVIVYFAGTRVLKPLLLPFALFLLAIPIPQIVFNRIAFPLQVWASQISVWVIRLFEVPSVRNGNVIDILPRGSTQPISLEVVEACSGIRSLMTLVTLALVLGYFTRRESGDGIGGFARSDLYRTSLLMLAAVPIAVLTNAGRVAATGVMTYWSGRQATQSTTHELSGWLVYVAALALLLLVNLGSMKLLPPRLMSNGVSYREPKQRTISWRDVAPVGTALIAMGLLVNWVATRSEIAPQREPLSHLSASFGDWQQRGSEIRFTSATEEVLRATDYTMREYMSADGRMANIYVGYYASQRTGATYHSPQNCLPGAGWVLGEPRTITVTTATGSVFDANLYIIENGVYREAMVYWYQGRGRIEASEYRDKLNTIWDSVTHRRTDGAMVRIMTGVGNDEAAAIRAVVDLSAKLQPELARSVPE